MKIKRRKILFSFFVLIFAMSSFIVIIYAQGYKIRFSWPINYKSLQKTGHLSIKTNPKGANIYINDEVYQSFWKKHFSKNKNKQAITPQKIDNLFPEKYNILLKLDGYHDIRKKVNIYSGKITAIDDLQFFKNNLPLKMNDSNFDLKNVSPNKEFIIYPEKGYILKLDGNNAIKLNIEGTNVKWSNNNNFSVNTSLFSIENLTKEKYNLDEIIGKKINDFKISNDGGKIYYKYKDKLFSFNLSKNENKEVLSDNVQDYLIKKDTIYNISSGDKQSIFSAFNINSNKTAKNIEIPCSDKYSFVLENHNLINIYNEKYETLYIIDINSPIFPIQAIINNIKYFNWENENKLIYANDYEIWSFDLDGHKKNIITRISNNIEGLVTHPVFNNNIIYWTESEIILLKRLENNKINITNLAKINKISDVIVSEDGENIYFNGKIGGQNGTYRLNIK